MSAPDGGATGHAFDLPADVLDLAADRLLTSAPAERADALEDLVRRHPALEGALRRLASELAGTERLLDRSYSSSQAPPAALGPYRVVRTLGEGAFGVVYLCRQETPVRRPVAVKVLRPGAGDRHTLARFEAERQVLAAFAHAAIAQVFDAGVLHDGRPWFAMEYVSGRPITEYCDAHDLGVDARLVLFVRLCHGVHHAHRRGIVHRDLKPANVLVCEHDGQAQVKIIDFGIAKALHREVHASTPRTETGRIVGTPGYMSPEQADGRTEDLDSRADVFALGIMLYELLTGELPWGRRPRSLATDPPRPSLRVATRATERASRRASSTSRKLAARLRGDLDWIVLRALARERERRYASARELAADLLRHRRGQPVSARPPTVGYRMRKLVRRHRAATGAAAAILTTITLAVGVSWRYRVEAQARATELEAAAADLLARANDPRIVSAPRSEPLRRALVGDALTFYERFLAEQPDEPRLRASRARALWTLSQVQWLVGEYASSESVARQAVEEAQGLVASAPNEIRYRGVLGNALRNVGRAASSAGRLGPAREAFDRAVDELGRCHTADPQRYGPLLVAALMEWSSSRTFAELGEATAALRRAVAIQEELTNGSPSPTASRDLLEVLTAWVSGLTQQGELDEAARAYRRVERVLAGTEGIGPAVRCHALGAGALLAGRQGDPSVAIARLTAAIAAARAWADEEPTWPQPWGDLLALHAELARQQRENGDLEAALTTSRAAVAIGEARVKQFPTDALARGQLADLLSLSAVELLQAGDRGPLPEAEASARRALVLLQEVPDTVDARMRERAGWMFASRLGFVLDAMGSDEAREQWAATARAIESWCRRFPPTAEDAEPLLTAMLRIARCHLGGGPDEADAAEAALAQAEAWIRQHASAAGGLSDEATELHRLRALLAAKRGDAERAAAESESAAEDNSGWRGRVAAAEGMVAAWQAAPSRVGRDRAIDWQRQAIEALRPVAETAPGDLWVGLPLAQLRLRLAELLLDAGERDAAAPLLEQALPALASMRDRVHRDAWDEALYRRGQALAAR